MGIISFNGNKIITSGGGGCIITDDEDLAKRASQQIIQQNSLLNYLSKEISIYKNLLQR